MKLQSLQVLYVHELKDLYSGESMIIKALPRMAKKAASPELRRALQGHLRKTEGHVKRLDRIFRDLDTSPRGKKCLGVEALLEEGKELLRSDAEEDTLDAGIIGAAQKVEHYEIAGYGTVRTWAQTLGRGEHARLLQEILDEEAAANEKLTEIAERGGVNAEAAEAGEGKVAVAGAPEGRGRRLRVPFLSRRRG